MQPSRFGWAVAAGMAFLSVVGCGGHGEGFRVAGNPITIQTTTLPPLNSGEELSFAFQIAGGSGGPYVLEVIEGALPQGVSLDNGTVGLIGQPLEDGVFTFTIKLTDTGAQPFATTTKAFTWVVGVGALVFVTDADLPDWIFNGFSAVELVVAGGTPPYQAEVVDDPLNPYDEPLPIGLAIPTDSTTILGAPTGVKAEPPFTYKVSVRATDANLRTVTKEFTISVLVPPVIIVTNTLLSGKCGVPYGDTISIAEGIPPFNHTLVDSVGSSNVLLGEPGSVGGVAKGAPLSAYAAETAVGPYFGKFPEGLALRETDGQILGIAYRSGAFSNFIYHVNSVVLPAVPSQNAWKAYTIAMADSAPPNVVLDVVGVLSPGSSFSTTLASATAPGANNFLVRSPEFGVAFNPVQFKATGGVTVDGKFAAPHVGQVTNNPGELPGGYDWSASSFPGGVPAGMSFSALGLFSGTPTSRSGFQVLNVVAKDAQLPIPVGVAHAASGFCRFDIGPDWVVITESSASSTAGTMDNSMDYNSQRVEILEPKTGVPVVRALSNATDMPSTDTHPLGGTLDGSLTNIDFLRVSVNPTWWAYDAYNLNASGARTMQHGDPERYVNSQSFGSDSTKSTYYSYIASNFNEGMEHASNPAIEIPETRAVSPFAVTHSPAGGVYTDGGLLYGYDKSGEFGFFIVRKDSKIQIPVAFNKSTFTGFGDAWISSSSAKTGMFRIPQITVSPDGRLAAAKLKVSIDTFSETVSAGQKVVIFSLTGKKEFAGGTSTFTVLDAGGAGNTTDGQYLYGDSLTLTNHALYALRGNNRGDLGDRVIYGDHWVWKASLFNPTSGANLGTSTMSLLASSFGGAGGWTNATNSPISVTYCKWATPGSSGLPASSGTSWINTTAAANNTNPSSVTPAVFGDNWANFGDSSGAPTPFRVSANGKACAMIAGANTTAAVVNTTTFLRRSVYVDFNDVFREAATTTRRYKAAARLVGERGGEQSNVLYGEYEGPATQFEISDAGDRIGIVYNASLASWTNSGASQTNFTDSYEAIAALTGTGSAADPWSSRTETLVTNPAGTPVFVNSVQWRMGSLAFTRDGAAFVFWAGYSLHSPTTFTSSFSHGGMLSGSVYSYKFGTSSVDGILPAAQGGHSDVTGTVKSYTTSSQLLHPTSGWSYAAPYNVGQGSILPVGCFVSNDGSFFYWHTLGALTAADLNGARLIGVNVKDTTSTINSRDALRAFAPNWIAQRGFANGQYAYPGTTVRGMGGPHTMIGSHVSAAGHPGLVFFSSTLKANSGVQDSTGNPTGGGPNHSTYWGDYATYSGELFGIDTSVGGNLFALSNISAPSTATRRFVTYIQPNRSGSRVAFVSATVTSSNGVTNPGAEELRIVSNVATSASGALSGSPTVAVLQSGGGRVSSSIALDFSDRRVYYGYSTSGDEKGMVITEKTLDGNGAVLAGGSGTRSFNGIGGTTNRFAVLWSGR